MISATKHLLKSLNSSVRRLHISPIVFKEDHRRDRIKASKVDEGVAGEKTVNIDSLVDSTDSMFPVEGFEKRLHNGVPFEELPVCNIRVSPNNTIITLTNAKGVVQMMRSCGMEGFKNTKKGTNIAGQATAVGIASRIINSGVKTVRVRVRGLGPGRMAAIKGLEMAGLDIVSITDFTKVSWNPPRPRKARRL